VRKNQDAFGNLLCDFLSGKEVREIIERDDGFVSPSESGIKQYFSFYQDWETHHQETMKYVLGRVLDVGCGAGRHSLYLQQQGYDVLGIDNSPLAVEVCKKRGLKNVKLLPISKLSPKLGKFDTVLMLGNNFGLVGNIKNAKIIFDRLSRITNPGARILAESLDPYQTTEQIHLDYHEFNKQRGRLPGQLRIRVRYEKYISPWFDYLLVSKAEMNKILLETSWRIQHCIDSENAQYVAVLVKQE